MGASAIRETWSSFWGRLLFLRYHADHPERWAKRRTKAECLAGALSLTEGARVLDLGCGDGILDICLADLGMRVTAIDRIAPVLEAARAEPGGDAVEFIHADLRQTTLPSATFDAALALELVGLMSRDDDAQLIARAAQSLLPGGRLVVDCPGERDAYATDWSRELEGGVLECHTTYDPETRLQHMVPLFRTATGKTVELHDPYDLTRANKPGVLRYIYTKAELSRVMAEAGFTVRDAEHYWGGGYYLLIGELPA